MRLNLSWILIIGLLMGSAGFGLCAPAPVAGPTVGPTPVAAPAATPVAATPAAAAVAPGKTSPAPKTTLPAKVPPMSKLLNGKSVGVVTITVEGDRLDYVTSSKKFGAHGNVKVTAEAAGIAGERVVIGAEELEADLTAGELKASKDVSVRTHGSEMVGDTLQYSTREDVLTLTRAKCSMSLPPNENTGAVMRAYAFGDTITRKADVIYILKGRITTCDRDDSDWSLQADKITYDPAKDRVTIQRPAFQLGHWRFPLPGSYSHTITTGREVSTSLLTTPGYSSRDGLFLPYYVQLGRQDSTHKADLDVRFTDKRGMRGLFHAERGNYPWRVDFSASREEISSTVLQNFLAISRVPEVSVTRLLRPTDANSAMNLTLSAGRFRERNLDLEDLGLNPPTVQKDRLALIAYYLDGQRAQRRHLGAWWGLTGSRFWYDGSEGYRSLAVQAGAGVRLGKKSKVGLTLIRNFDSGVTPLIEDQVQIYREAQPYCDLRIAPQWALEALGRYDWGSEELRDYTVKLRHITHCISWVASYRKVGGHFSIGMELNGITNDVEDYHPQPLLPPVPPESKTPVAPTK